MENMKLLGQRQRILLLTAQQATRCLYWSEFPSPQAPTPMGPLKGYQMVPVHLMGLSHSQGTLEEDSLLLWQWKQVCSLS